MCAQRHLSYAIDRHTMPDGSIVIKGRGIHDVAGWPIFAAFCCGIYLPILSGSWKTALIAAPIFASLLLLHMFIARFRIIISADNVTIQLLYLGIVTRRIVAPMQHAYIDDDAFAAMNGDKRSLMLRDETNKWLSMEYSDDYDTDNMYVWIRYGDKDMSLYFPFSSQSFERELWLHLIAAFNEVDKKNYAA